MQSENPSQWTILEPLCYSSFFFATLVYGVIGYKFCWLLPQSRSTNWTRISWDTNWARINYTNRNHGFNSLLRTNERSCYWFRCAPTGVWPRRNKILATSWRNLCHLKDLEFSFLKWPIFLSLLPKLNWSVLNPYEFRLTLNKHRPLHANLILRRKKGLDDV